MNAISDIVAGMLGDSSAMMLALLVFLATTVLTFGVMLTMGARCAAPA
jgi:hypothetical protein